MPLPLNVRLADALRSAAAQPDSSGAAPALAVLADVEPSDRRDRVLTLLTVYDLHSAPLPALGALARLQHHPGVAALKGRLEASWLADLDAVGAPADLPSDDAVTALRTLGARERLPWVYRWLATEADAEGLRRYLALEGGPDGGFDDLVAVCQVGLTGRPKMEMGQNYWDEMGNGSLDDVHTTLHQRMAAALDVAEVPREEQPVEALERTALGGLLATNRWLQPEMVGALGMIELQAGPRCRLVLQGLARLDAPAGAAPFYQVHAEVDPRHGADWLAEVVGPLQAEHPDWAPRMLRGAWWRWSLGAAFFGAAEDLLIGEPWVVGRPLAVAA